MYSEKVVQERLALAREELGFVPEYQSVDDVQTFNERMERKYEEVYRNALAEAQGGNNPTQAYRVCLTRALCDPTSPKLTTDEVRWISNERYLSMCDAAYWMTRYYYVKDERNEIRRFTFRAAQQVYFNVVSELEARGSAIELLCNKGRQLGVSTETEGLQTHRICFTYGVNAVVASYDRQKTGLMAQMMFLAYDMMPWWMPPMDTRRVESDQGMLVFGGMRSGVSFQHGMQTSGIARGSTPTVYHLSEVASFPNPEELIEASLFKAVHAAPNVFGVLESTAEGSSGWWYDSYWYAKKNWQKGRSRMCALFLPWFMGTDIYPTPTWIRTHPVPEGWHPKSATRAMMAKAKLYVQSNSVLEKVLGSKWQMGNEQGWWWEVNFEEAKAKGKEKLFFQELPTDDVESFQGSYDSVFGRDTIIEAYDSRKQPAEVYGIIGQSIEDRHEPDPEDVDYSKPRQAITYKATNGKTYTWEFIPMKWHESWDSLEGVMDDDSHQGKLFIYHPPEPGYDYSEGVDTSNGIGSDDSCIAMCRRAKNPSEPDVQAAEFRSSTISHVEIFPYAMAIATYFAKHMASTTQYREPYVSIEQIAAVGDTCQLQMKKMGYNRFHKMIRYDGKDFKKGKAKKLGWYTNSWSRSMLTDGFVIAVQNGWYIVNSPWTAWEMDHWEVHLTASNKSKFEHSSEATDDGIFANAMATFCPNDVESLTKRTKKLKMQFNNGTALPPIDIGPYAGPLINPRGHGTIHNPRRDKDLRRFL